MLQRQKLIFNKIYKIGAKMKINSNKKRTMKLNTHTHTDIRK